VYQFKLRKGAEGVELTYKRRSVEVEVFPKPLQVGERVTDAAFGPGSVVHMEYESEAAIWLTSIEHDNGQNSILRRPVRPIILFADGPPTHKPKYETVDKSFVEVYPKCKRNILKCLTELPLLRDTAGAAGEWAEYFTKTDADMARCLANPDQPWF
jgi:hypothetical protein